MTPRIRVLRHPETVRALGLDGLVPAHLYGWDRLELVVRGEVAIVAQGLTAATETERDAAPIIAPGLHAAVYCPGLHKGRPALVQQGLQAIPYTRGGTHTVGDYTGLNLHSWRGRSDGCLTAPGWFIEAVLSALDELAQSGDWQPRRHPDGRWCVDLEVIEGTRYITRKAAA